jgi:uncharacterized membrane protein
MPNKQDQEIHEEARPIKQEPLDLNEVLKSLDPQKREIITKAIYAIEEQKSFSGPLPAPEDFMAYKNVMPDAPERILAMAERQSQHRINTETKIVESGIRESKRGQLLGATIVIGCLICSVILGLQGHDVLAGSIVTIIAAVATIFVLHKDPSHDNNSEKE